MTSIQHLRSTDYRRMPWKNGQGWTTEIYLAPDTSGVAGFGFDWRISIAEIEAATTFSAFPGYDRALLVLDGNGIVLDIGTRDALNLRRGQIVSFTGEDAVSCAPLAGPTRDFNVMSRRGGLEASLMFRPLVGALVFLPEAGVFWAVHLLSGAARYTGAAEPAELVSGDTLLIGADGAAAADRVVLNGAGEVVVVRFRRTASAT